MAAFFKATENKLRHLYCWKVFISIVFTSCIGKGCKVPIFNFCEWPYIWLDIFRFMQTEVLHHLIVNPVCNQASPLKHELANVFTFLQITFKFSNGLPC